MTESHKAQEVVLEVLAEVFVYSTISSTIDCSILVVLVEANHHLSDKLVISDTPWVDRALSLYVAFYCVVMTDNYVC